MLLASLHSYAICSLRLYIAMHYAPCVSTQLCIMLLGSLHSYALCSLCLYIAMQYAPCVSTYLCIILLASLHALDVRQLLRVSSKELCRKWLGDPSPSPSQMVILPVIKTSLTTIGCLDASRTLASSLKMEPFIRYIHLWKYHFSKS